MKSKAIIFQWKDYRIGGAMVSVLVSSAVVRRLEPRSGQTKDYKIGICCFSAKHAALSRKSKYWLAGNHDNALADRTKIHEKNIFWLRKVLKFCLHNENPVNGVI